MKFYVTKYALTSGIREVEADEPSDGSAYISVKEWHFACFALGRDAFRTREEAEARAVVMAKKKLANLRKQIAKVEHLVVEPKWGKR